MFDWKGMKQFLRQAGIRRRKRSNRPCLNGDCARMARLPSDAARRPGLFSTRLPFLRRVNNSESACQLWMCQARRTGQAIQGWRVTGYSVIPPPSPLVTPRMDFGREATAKHPVMGYIAIAHAIGEGPATILKTGAGRPIDPPQVSEKDAPRRDDVDDDLPPRRAPSQEPIRDTPWASAATLGVVFRAAQAASKAAPQQTAAACHLAGRVLM